MNFLGILQLILKLTPYVVAGVEQIHAGASTETKTQLAQDLLTTATAGAVSVLSPEDSQLAQVVSGTLSTVISSAQQVATAAKAPTPNEVAVAVAAPAPAARPAVQGVGPSQLR